MSFKKLSALPKEMIEPILFKMPLAEIENMNLTCSKMHQTVQKLRNKLYSRKAIGLTIEICFHSQMNFAFYLRSSERPIRLSSQKIESLLSNATVYSVVVNISRHLEFEEDGDISALVATLDRLKISCVKGEMISEVPEYIVEIAEKINFKTTMRTRWAGSSYLPIGSNEHYHSSILEVLIKAENISCFEYRVEYPENVNVNRFFDFIKNFHTFGVLKCNSDQFYDFLDQLRHAPNCNLKHFETSGITTRFEDYIWKPPSTSLWDMSLIPVIYLQRTIMDYIQKIDFVPPCDKCILVGKSLVKQDDSLRVVRNNPEEILDTILEMVNIRMNAQHRHEYLNSSDEQEKRELLGKAFMDEAPSPFERDGSSDENADEE